MLGVRIFQKSLYQIYYNFSDAFKLTGLLYLIMTVLNIIITYSSLGMLSLEQVQALKNAEEVALSSTYWLTILVLMALNFVFTAWIAVLWHRYMLLAERPQSALPSFRSQDVFGYISKSVVLGLVLMAAMVPAMIVMVVLGMMGAQMMGVAMVLAIVYILYISLRISLVLPAKSIGKDMLVGQSWNATGSASSAILTTTLLLGAFSIGLQAIPQYFIANAAIKLVIGSVMGWVVLLVGVSVLTTLYGYLIEGRSLD